MTVDPEEFEALEDDTDAFAIRVDGVPVWERIRFDVFRSIQEQNGVGQAQPQLDRDVRDHFMGLSNWLKNWVSRNPYLADPANVMFVGHPRRKLHDDGLWWDIYCDPIHESCNLDSVHFEQPYLLEHKRPPKTEGVRYLDLIEHGGYLQRKLGMHRVSVPDEEADCLRVIDDGIAASFDASVDIERRAYESLRRRRSELWLYERLLSRVSPEVVVIVVGYGKEPLIEACQRSGIPVIELQHGVIHQSHFAYHFSGDRTKEMFPDYLLTWGEYWNDCVEYPIEDDRVVAVGYPYLEQSVDEFYDIDSKDQLLFISQGPIGEQLTKFAMEVDHHPSIGSDVVYKLHPGEYDRWEVEYPWLLEADFEIVDSSDDQLYRLFAESSTQIGVGSTAIYEGLAFGLETYVYDCPGSSALQPLVDEGAAKRVSSAEELATAMRTEKTHSFDRKRYFEPDATEKIPNTIKNLAEGC